jgi:anion-transporting  ArsA/GET3 family ATPase
VKIVVCLGTGGVGKTSVAAALAWNEAGAGRKTLVLTIDPARRLRTVLGLDLQRGEHRVELPIQGEFWAAQLDVEHTLEQAVRLYGRPEQVDRVLHHSIYRMLVSSLAGMQELMAIEYLDQVVHRGFETIVVDTAPSRHAFEFLEKPERFAELVEFPLVRLVGKSYRLWADSVLGRWGRRSLDLYARLEELVGTGVIADVLEFYSLFRTIAEGYAERARKTVERLRRDGTFWIVTVPAKAIKDVQHFSAGLRSRRFPVQGVIVNRMFPWFPPEDPGRFGEVWEWCRDLHAEHEAVWEELQSRWRNVLELRRLSEMPATGQGIDLVQSLAAGLASPAGHPLAFEKQR